MHDLDEDEDGWELEEEREAVDNALIEIKDCVNNVFEKYIAKMNDLCLNTMSLEFEFGGRGECLQDVFEIAEKVFGYECAEEIGNYYDEFDETEDSDLFFDNLRQMKELKLLTDQSIEALVNFFVECEWAPDLCTITLKRANDTQIEMIISWE